MQKIGSLKVLITLFIMFFSTVIFAEEKNYTVISSDGVKIAVQEKGNPEGQPLIFIHGLLGSHLNWEKQINDGVLNKYRLITFDLRGHGVSDKPDNEKSYLDGQLWADDLNAVIKKSRAERPILIGWSLGGAIITNYLAKYTDRDIRGAVYVGGVVELTVSQIPAHPSVYLNMVSEDLRTHLDGENAFLRLCFYTQPDRVTFERFLSAAALANFTMQKAVPNMSIRLEEGIKNTKVPILFINGQYDALVNHKTSVERALDVNPKIKFLVFKNSGHAPFNEESYLFNQVLDQFIKKH